MERPAGIEPVVIGLEDRSSAIELRTLWSESADCDAPTRVSPNITHVHRPTPSCGRTGGRGCRSWSLAGVAILLLSACSSNPPVISGDTSCERFRHISATPAQIKVFADNWEVMETYADAIVAHNLEYDAHCLRGGE